MKTTLFYFLFLFTFSISAQNFEETQQWIMNNAKATNFTTASQQVFYSKSKKLIYFVKVLQLPSGGHTFTTQVFDPKMASSIVINKNKDSDGGHNLTLWFSESTPVYSIDLPMTGPYQGTRLNNKIIESYPLEKGIRRHGIEIYLSSDREHINRVKKAYIHLFQTLGYTVRDGDNMF